MPADGLGHAGEKAEHSGAQVGVRGTGRAGSPISAATATAPGPVAVNGVPWWISSPQRSRSALRRRCGSSSTSAASCAAVPTARPQQWNSVSNWAASTSNTSRTYRRGASRGERGR
ncbi:hypothetical protein ACPPVO_38485 [Dactylosporangium sp. McL0621]|uniref:hypothetical protein n=1 Tax=Dactylosporangium sp. McL0621 TaxID=3415678 RepID=UPI003CF8027B